MSRGFTLIEILLTVAIVTILLGISTPAYTALFHNNDLDVARNQTALVLGRAATLARAADGDTTWGVKVQTGSITLFRGGSYAGRDSTYDELYPIADSIAVSGTTEYVFAKLTGLPLAAGTLTLTGGNGSVKNLIVNTKGMVQ